MVKWVPIHDAIRKKIVAKCPEDSVILEVGSGPCKLISLLIQKRPRFILGCDRLNFSFLHKKSGAYFIKCDIEYLPLKECYFTISIVTDVSQELNNSSFAKVLSELTRVTIKSGLVIFDFYNAASPGFYIKMAINWKMFRFYQLPISFTDVFIRSIIRKNELKIEENISLFLHPDTVERKTLFAKLLRPLSLTRYKMTRKNPAKGLVLLYICRKA